MTCPCLADPSPRRSWIIIRTFSSCFRRTGSQSKKCNLDNVPMVFVWTPPPESAAKYVAEQTLRESVVSNIPLFPYNRGWASSQFRRDLDTPLKVRWSAWKVRWSTLAHAIHVLSQLLPPFEATDSPTRKTQPPRTYPMHYGHRIAHCQPCGWHGSQKRAIVCMDGSEGMSTQLDVAWCS